MRATRWVLPAALLLGLGACAAPAKNGPTIREMMKKYDWALSYEEGLRKAQEKDKPIILFFYHGLCFSCRTLVLDAGADPRVSQLINEFIFVAVNTGKDREARKRFDVRKVPDVRYMTKDGVEVGRNRSRDMTEVAIELERVLRQVNHTAHATPEPSR